MPYPTRQLLGRLVLTLLHKQSALGAHCNCLERQDAAERSVGQFLRTFQCKIAPLIQAPRSLSRELEEWAVLELLASLHVAATHQPECPERSHGSTSTGSNTLRSPEAEKQWWNVDKYAFSCTVDLLDVRHLLRQYSNTLAHRPVSGLHMHPPTVSVAL